MNFFQQLKSFFSFFHKKNEINQRIINLIEINDYDSILKIMENGHVLSNKLISEHLLNLNDDDQITPILANILKNKNTQYKSFFEDYSNEYVKKYLDGTITIEIINQNTSPEAEVFFENSNSKMNSKIFFNTPLFLVSRFILKNALDKISLNEDEMFSYIKKNQKNIQQLENFKKDYSDNTELVEFTDNIIELLLISKNGLDYFYKKFNKNEQIDTPSNDKKNIYDLIDIQLLTQETVNIIDKIDELYDNLALINDLDQEKIFIVNNLYENKIIEMINKYLNIPEELRDTKKDRNGQTGIDLLNNSLNEIQSIFNDIIKEHANNQAEVEMSELRVKNTYIQKIKNGM